MTEIITNALRGKKILILGFGKEGRSSLKFIQTYLPGTAICIADRNHIPDAEELIKNNPSLKIQTGEAYLNTVDDYDIVIKSPGISLRLIPANKATITSQTDLFLQAFSRQTIGVTGTKGKSTTASLIHYLLEKLGFKALLTGNIGLPAFDVIPLIKPDTFIVYELSANQLEILQCSPHIALLLNIFEEHLDHFGTYDAYKAAKANIFRHGLHTDFLVASANTIALTGLIPVQKIIDIQDVPASTELKIKGEHNRRNVGAALSILMTAGIDPYLALHYLPDFSGLPHRLEYIGNFEGIDFYNDSIATVPEATIAAMETLGKVDFLILGGFDRGISYQALADYLLDKPGKKILFSGLAGERISALLAEKSRHGLIAIDSLDDMVQVLKKFAQSGDVCLLSPAAASYDRFKNFEHRGDHFKQLVRSNFNQ